MNSLVGTVSRSEDIPWDIALTLAEISNVAYSDDDDQKVFIKQLGASEVQPISRGSSHGVVASNDKVVVIAFRGTKDAADWLTDSRIIGHRVADGRMHRGFFGAVDVIFKDIYEEAIRQGAAKKAVWITGHSLGGAMAVVFTYRAVNDKELVPSGVITFGQPLVLSTTLAQFMLDKFEYRYIRFVNNWDPVTRLLPNYRHAGSRIHLSGDNYGIRKPMIAVSAPSNGSARIAPKVLPFEEDEQLKPMTETEFQDFQNKLKTDRSPPKAAPNGRPVVTGAIPLLSAHSMLTYIDRLKSIGQKNWK